MKIDADKVLVDFNGKPFVQTIHAGEQIVGQDNLTVGDVCIDALVIPIRSDAEPKQGQAVAIFKLAQAFQSVPVDLSIEQISILKHRVETAGRFSPWVVGQVIEHLENPIL